MLFAIGTGGHAALDRLILRLADACQSTISLTWKPSSER
jgi:hypothetical protein